MKPAEKVGIDELNESGIVHVGLEFCPTIGFDEMGLNLFYQELVHSIL